MDRFKHFLENRGADLCKSSQFLQYYALPYVPDPRRHPSFNDIFADSWVPNLVSSLSQFLDKALNSRSTPKLLSLIRESQRSDETDHLLIEVKTLKAQIKDQLINEDALKSKLKLLQTDYHNLITIASELVQTLASCIAGQRITPEYLSRIVQKLSSFKKSASHARGKQQSSMKPPAPGLADFYQPKQQVSSLPVEQRMDYNGLQKFLMTQPKDEAMVRRQALLLQALRFRLMRAQNGSSRRTILNALIAHDFLSMKPSENKLMKCILDPRTPSIVREQLARLTNMLATDSAGREYLLLRNGQFVTALVNAMKQETVDSEYRQNILGTLQKLSLRRLGQSVMNKEHVVTFLQEVFKDLDNLSEYTIEYGSALMMNLCLRTAGRKECIANPERTLHVLNELIEHDNVQVKTYVNGTLYSILSEPSLKEQARAIGLEEQLKYLLQVSDEQLVKQIEFVIERLNNEEEDDESNDAESEDGEEDDNIDEDDDVAIFEDDDEHFNPHSANEKSGDELLEVFTKDPSIINGRRSSLSLSSTRPTTPLMARRTSLSKVVGKQGTNTNFSIEQLKQIAAQTQQAGNNNNSVKSSPFNGPKNPDEEQEFSLAFATRSKIVRTPDLSN